MAVFRRFLQSGQKRGKKDVVEGENRLSGLRGMNIWPIEKSKNGPLNPQKSHFLPLFLTKKRKIVKK